MTNTNSTSPSKSEFSPTDANSRCTIDVEKYMVQLEKRVMEQEQLIALLNEKIAGLESGKVQSYASVAQAGTSQDGGSAARVRSSSSLGDSGLTFVGSKKTTISSVVTVRYTSFFVSRLDPSLSATDLAKDLLKDAEGLTSVKCSKMQTKHSSYSSFHVAVPEEQKQHVSSGDVWPEGSFVKLFFGRLLPSHVLESFDSQSNEYQSFSAHTQRKPHTVKSNDVGPSSSSTNVKKPTTDNKKAPVKPVLPRPSSGSTVESSSPKNQVSPKNLRSAKTTKPR